MREQTLSNKPLAVDLYCGLGGWTEGLLAEGFRVVGFDVERHRYPVFSSGGKSTGTKVSGLAPGKFPPGGLAQGAIDAVGRGADPIGWQEYPAQLVIQDVLTIHGSQFKTAALIVASPPCQEYSYMAMPWSRAKAIAADYRSGKRDVKKLTALFDACFRIQREASEAAGHHIPMVVENVRGAIPWVGRSRWNFGSFHLWGDVPALMPMVAKRHAKVGGIDFNDFKNGKGTSPAFNDTRHAAYQGQKVPGFRFDGSGKAFQTASVEGTKTVGHVNKRDGHSHTRHLRNQAESDGAAKHGSKSNARKAASAVIAKIPLTLSTHIAKVYHP